MEDSTAEVAGTLMEDSTAEVAAELANIFLGAFFPWIDDSETVNIPNISWSASDSSRPG